MSRYFAEKPGQPRARSARDAIAIVVGLALLIWTSFRWGEVSTTDQWFLDLLELLPAWFDDIWKVGYFLGLIMVIGLFAAAILQQRGYLLRDLVLAVVATFFVAVSLAWLISDTFPTLLPELTRPRDPETAFPILRVAMVTSVIYVASPHLARPVRLFGWFTVLVGAVSGFGLGFGLPSDALGAIGLGLVAGGSVLLIFGSPRGYPDIEEVTEALAELDVDVDDLTLVPDQSWGTRTLAGTLEDGTPIEVLAYGRDAADTRMAARLWHALWYRDSDRTISFSRLEAVEHDALAMLMAANQGVNAQQPLAVGVAGDDMAVLARSADGEPLVDPSQDQLEAVWRQVMKLHDAGIAHGNLTLDAVSVDDGEILLGDFADASFHATEAQKSKDVVSLLYETAAAAGVETAVAAAAAVVPEDQLVDALAYMQVPALRREQRQHVDKPKALLNDLKDAIARETGAEVPEEAKLRRIRPKDLIMPALSLVAVYALIGMLGDIDFAAVWDVVRDATWVLIVIGFLIGQTVFFFEATAMLFATGYPLPMKPLVVLQLGVKWIGLAVPSAAGRVTMNTLFLRKYGVPPTIAVTQGAIDSLAGFFVEGMILLVAFIAADIDVEIDTGDVRWGLILGIVLLVIVGTVVAVLKIQKLHDRVIPVIRDAWSSVSGLITSPKQVLGLLGSNVASRVVLATVLWFVLEAIGAPLPLVTCLVVTVATNLLAGLVPIPGGIGVAEAVMTSFLVLAGLDSDTAFAAAVVYRMAQFYIPAGEGFFATRWLEAGDYI